MRKLFYFLLLGIFLASCTPAASGLKKDLPGTWQNPQGFQIEFDAGGGGFIPGVPGKIPDTSFTYSIVDDTHVKITAQGQSYTVEMRISGDTLTWKDQIGEVQYTRVKK